MPSRPPWETSERDTFRVTFDEDVEAYDRTRPVAPRYVFDDLVELAGVHPGSSVVEVGPGTGQASRPLAERRLQIVALELGPRLAARARRNLSAFAEVEVVATSYEAWDPGSARFDAVFACNSFHWVDPAIRFHKSGAVLRPGGHLIVLATPWVIPADADRFWWDVQDGYFAVAAGGSTRRPSTPTASETSDRRCAPRDCSRCQRSGDTSSRSPSPPTTTPSTSRPSRQDPRARRRRRRGPGGPRRLRSALTDAHCESKRGLRVVAAHDAIWPYVLSCRAHPGGRTHMSIFGSDGYARRSRACDWSTSTTSFR